MIASSDSGSGIAKIASASVVISSDAAVATATTAGASTTSYTPSFTGRAYYVDSNAGSDLNVGTIDRPWKTLARATRAVLSAGDALLLNCGSRWREAVEFNTAFAPAGSVLIGGYGDCSGDRRPEISGADGIVPSAWTLSASTATGEIYTARPPADVVAVARGTDTLLRARHPNFAGLGKDFSVAASGTYSAKIMLSSVDQAAVGSQSVDGATMVVRSAPFMIEQKSISVYDMSTGGAVLASASAYSPAAGSGYYLEGKPWMLDSDGEWLYDSTSGLLSVFVAKGATWLGSTTLDVMRSRTTLTVRGIPNVRIERVRVSNSGEYGIRVIESGQARVSGVYVQNSRNTGIIVETVTGLPASQNVTIENSFVDGANVAGIGTSVTGARVIGNTITNVGMLPSSLRPTAAIRLSEANSIASRNEIDQSGYSAILMANRVGMELSDNVIRGACLRLTDCGAIYTWGTNPTTSRSSVTRNRISGVSTPNLNGAGGGAPELVAGIYLDEGSNNIDVKMNWLSDVRVGISLHKSSNNWVTDNIIHMASDSAIRMHSTGTDTGTLRNNIVRRNTMFVPNYFVKGGDGVPVKSGGVAQEWIHEVNATWLFTAANNVSDTNVVVHMGDASALRWRMRSGSNAVDREATGWATYAPTDRTTAPYRAQMASVTGNQLVSNSTMDPSGAPWTTYSYVSGASVATFGYNGMCAGNCASLAPKTDNDVLLQSTLKVVNPSVPLMYLRYRAVGGPVATASKLEIRADVSPYAPAGYMEPLITLPANQERRQETFFTRNTNQNLRLSIKALSGTSVLLDDVLLYEVTDFQLRSPLTMSRLLVNQSSSDASFTCAGLGLSVCTVVDASGNPLSWPITLPANAAKMIFIKDPVWVM